MRVLVDLKTGLYYGGTYLGNPVWVRGGLYGPDGAALEFPDVISTRFGLKSSARADYRELIRDLKKRGHRIQAIPSPYGESNESNTQEGHEPLLGRSVRRDDSLGRPDEIPAPPDNQVPGRTTQRASRHVRAGVPAATPGRGFEVGVEVAARRRRQNGRRSRAGTIRRKR